MPKRSSLFKRFSYIFAHLKHLRKLTVEDSNDDDNDDDGDDNES